MKASRGPKTPILTALPAVTNADDGLEINYLADAANGIVWRLRYRAFQADGVTPNPSAYKWEYIGGPPLRFANGTQSNGTAAEAAGWTNLGGGSITVPLAGDYLDRHGAQLGVAGGALSQTAYIGAAIGDTTPPAQATALFAADAHTTTGGTAWASAATTYLWTGLAAGNVIKLRYLAAGTATNSFWVNKWLELTPVRVG